MLLVCKMEYKAVSSLVSSTISALERARKDYDVIKNDGSLRRTFHEAGRGLELVESGLQRVKTNLESKTTSTDLHSTAKSLEACNAKAKRSETIYKSVAQEQQISRHERYSSVAQQQGQATTVEALSIGMMKDVCDLAASNAAKGLMEDELRKLHDAINDLGRMEPSVSAERERVVISNWGSGQQFNNSGGGTQSNNLGSGHQFTGATFSGTVHFGTQPSS